MAASSIALENSACFEVNGSTFRQILAHYYPGAQLIQLDQLLQK